MAIEQLLHQRARIERATPAVSPAGDVTRIWSLLAEDVPCRLQREQTISHLQPVGEVAATRLRAFLPADTDLRPASSDARADRLTVEGVSYLVTGVEKARGLRLALLVADLERIGT